MTDSSAAAYAGLMRLVNGYQVSQALHVISVLGIADLLAAGPRSSDDLAKTVSAHPGTLYRVLRALAAAKVFREHADRVFSLSDMGQCLRTDAAAPIGPWAAHIGRPYTWCAWAHLLQSVLTGQSAFRSAHGCDAWEYRAEHPDDGAVFDAAMVALSQDVAMGVVAAYDFSPFSFVVDVGGGHGALLAKILAAHPELRGVLFDQAHVLTGARPILEGLGVIGRCELVAGSFFEQVPPGDLMLLKGILHDWDDALATAILRSCRRAINPGGRILVIERVLHGPNEGPEAKFFDLAMLVGTGGQERTGEEFAALFASAGLKLTRLITTNTRMTIVEGTCI